MDKSQEENKFEGESWIISWIIEAIKKIDEGIVFTVSKTGLAWSLLLFITAYTFYEYGGNSSTYLKKITTILMWYPFIVAATGFSIGLYLISQEKQNMEQFKEDLKFVSGLVALISGYILLLTHNPVPDGLIGAIIMSIFLIVGYERYKKRAVKE